MKEWVSAINSAMNKIRPKDKRTQQQLREKSPHLSSITKTKENGSRMPKTKQHQQQPSSATTTMTTDLDGIQEVTGTLPRPTSTRLDCALAKSRVKGPAGRRLPRKPSHPSPSLASSSSSSGRKKVKAVIEKSEDDDDDDDDLRDLDNDSNHKQGTGAGAEDDKKIRDSRGRATSLSTLEKSLVNEGGGEEEHKNNSNNNPSQKSSTSSGSNNINNNSNSRLAESPCLNVRNSDDDQDDQDLDCAEESVLVVEASSSTAVVSPDPVVVESEGDSDSDNFDFDRAWFFNSPGLIDQDRESTSDYFSMGKGGSRSLSVTPNSGHHNGLNKKKHDKTKCSIL